VLTGVARLHRSEGSGWQLTPAGRSERRRPVELLVTERTQGALERRGVGLEKGDRLVPTDRRGA
jgi:hypothetical protein